MLTQAGSIQGLPEAGPATARIIFMFRAEQGIATADAVIAAGLPMFVITATKGWLGALLTTDPEGIFIQLLFPLFFSFIYFTHKIF